MLQRACVVTVLSLFMATALAVGLPQARSLAVRHHLPGKPAAASGGVHAASEAQRFFLRPNDTVVFLGDSITALNAGTWPQGTTRPNYTYCVDIVSWAATHLAGCRVAFYDLGVPGDTAQGDIWPSGGPSSLSVPPGQTIDQHLQYAERLNPTVVTINLGMNDGEYVDCDPANPGYNSTLYNSFKTHLTHIVATLLRWSARKGNTLRLVVLSPSYFDNAQRIATGWKFGWGAPVANYNQTLLAFGRWEKSYVASLDNPNVTFINLNEPMRAATAQLPPGQSLTQEGIHPTEQGYEVMAATILDAWGAGAITSQSGNRPWPLYNGGSAYAICPLMAKVSGSRSPSPSEGSDTTVNQGTIGWQNNLIGLIRDQFICDETSTVRNFTVPPWNGMSIYKSASQSSVASKQ